MARDDEETSWTRQLLVTLGALVAVALIIGVVAGVVAVGAVKVTGLGATTSTATAAPSLYLPSGSPTEKPETYPDPSGGTSSAAPSPTPTKPRAKPRALSLQAMPTTVSPGQRINLTGRYRGNEGARLRVQRFEGGAWTDFPVEANVTGGGFGTYVTTSRSGVNRLRVLDPGTGKASNVVRVTVR